MKRWALACGLSSWWVATACGLEPVELGQLAGSDPFDPTSGSPPDVEADTDDATTHELDAGSTTGPGDTTSPTSSASTGTETATETTADTSNSSGTSSGDTTSTTSGESGEDSTGVDDGPVPNLPDPPFDYDDELPPHFEAFAELDNTPKDNPTTNAGATLGRVLFYDRRLSGSGTMRCADCHRPELAFADGESTSMGDAGDKTTRNTSALINLRWAPARPPGTGPNARGGFGWDGRSANLEAHIRDALADRQKMASDAKLLLARLRATRFYPRLFAQAFGDPKIEAKPIIAALAQFVRALVSHRSAWDRALVDLQVGLEINGIGPAQLVRVGVSESAARGYQLFDRLDCDACHGTLGFPARPALFNTGLELEYVDAGLGALTTIEGDMDRFRTPDLRNVAVTGPYLHDGRFAELVRVLDHYGNRVVEHRNLDPRIRVDLALEREQISDLAAFLALLNDRAFTLDPRYADPFPPE